MDRTDTFLLNRTVKEISKWEHRRQIKLAALCTFAKGGIGPGARPWWRRVRDSNPG